MGKLCIICVDDQREVLNALTEDLEEFEKYAFIEECESANEAWQVIESLDVEGDHVALVITDQVMPENSGVTLLKKLKDDERFEATRKVLLTGLATHQDTIEAINSASLDNYIEKPWDKANLYHIISVLLTKFIMGKGIDYQPYLPILDQKTLYSTLRTLT